MESPDDKSTKSPDIAFVIGSIDLLTRMHKLGEALRYGRDASQRNNFLHNGTFSFREKQMLDEIFSSEEKSEAFNKAANAKLTNNETEDVIARVELLDIIPTKFRTAKELSFALIYVEASKKERASIKGTKFAPINEEQFKILDDILDRNLEIILINILMHALDGARLSEY